MTGNRSLDEFAPGESADGEGSEDGESAADVDPIAPTYAWSPDGAACAGCGAVVERRWRDDGELVCADCKPW